MIYEKWQSASKTMSTSQPRCAVKDEVELEQHTASSDVKKVERQDKQLTFDGCVTRAFKCGRRRGKETRQAAEAAAAGNINLTGQWTPHGHSLSQASANCY